MPRFMCVHVNKMCSFLCNLNANAINDFARPVSNVISTYQGKINAVIIVNV